MLCFLCGFFASAGALLRSVFSPILHTFCAFFPSVSPLPSTLFRFAILAVARLAAKTEVNVVAAVAMGAAAAAAVWAGTELVGAELESAMAVAALEADVAGGPVAATSPAAAVVAAVVAVGAVIVVRVGVTTVGMRAGPWLWL